MVQIEKLKKAGFFEMNINEQIFFLRKHGFFKLKNQNKISRNSRIILFRYK